MRSSSFAGSSRTIDAQRLIISSHLSRPLIDCKLWDGRRNPNIRKLCLTGVFGLHGFQQAAPLFVDRDLSISIAELLRYDDRVWQRVEIEHTDGELDLIVAVAMSTNRIREIWFSEFDFQASSSTSHALATGLKYNRSVTELRIRRSRMNGGTPVAINVIGIGLEGNPSIESISLEQCNLLDAEIAKFVKSLRNCPSLSKFSVEGNSCRDLSIHELNLLLREIPVQNLSLHNQRLEHSERLDISPIANCLRGNNCRLRYLDVSRNQLGDDDVSLIMDGLLDGNHSLVTLHLDQNLISNEGARIIAEALPNLSSSLKTLALPENQHISKLGATMLLDSIRNQFYIHTLILPSGLAHIQRKIRWYANMNRGGRRLFSTPREVAVALYPLIIEHVNNIPASHSWNPEIAAPETIYGFLRFGPILFERESDDNTNGEQ